MTEEHKPVCSLCGGEGWYAEAQCCGKGRNGECCGDPDAVQVQCECSRTSPEHIASPAPGQPIFGLAEFLGAEDLSLTKREQP